MTQTQEAVMRMLILLALLASCSSPTVDAPSVDTPDDPVVVYSNDTVDTDEAPASDDDTDCHAVFGSGNNPCDTLLDTDAPVDTDVQDDTDTTVDSDAVDTDADDTDVQETGIPYCYDQVPGDECYCDRVPTDPWCLPPVDTDVPADSDDTVETDMPEDSDIVETDVPFDERCPPPTELYEWVRGGDLFCYCSFNPGSAACVCPSRPVDDPWCHSEGWPW